MWGTSYTKHPLSLNHLTKYEILLQILQMKEPVSEKSINFYPYCEVCTITLIALLMDYLLLIVLFPISWAMFITRYYFSQCFKQRLAYKHDCPSHLLGSIFILPWQMEILLLYKYYKLGRFLWENFEIVSISAVSYGKLNICIGMPPSGDSDVSRYIFLEFTHFPINSVNLFVILIFLKIMTLIGSWK